MPDASLGRLTALVSRVVGHLPISATAAGLKSGSKHVLRSPPGHSGPLSVKPGTSAPADQQGDHHGQEANQTH